MKYQINGIVFNTEDHSLSHGDRQVFLEAKSFQLLLVFIEYREKVLSRDDLINLVWQGQVVTDGAVNKAISKLRHHLESLLPGQMFIETKPKFGYVFTANVTEVVLESTVHRQKNRLPGAVLFAGIMAFCLFLAWAGLNQLAPLNTDTHITAKAQLIRFTAHDGVETQVSSAANGDTLYHSYNSTGERKLYLSRTDGTLTTLTLPLQRLEQFSLSPSGKHIAAVKRHDDECSIVSADIETTTYTALMNCDRFSNVKVAWANDEQSLFIQGRESNAAPFHIYQFKLATKTFEQVSLSVGLGHMQGDYALATHANLPLLAFVRYLGSEQSEVHVLDTVTLNTLWVYSFPHGVSDLAWALDKEQLFIANQKDVYMLERGNHAELIKQFSYPIESITSSKLNDKPSILAT